MSDNAPTTPEGTVSERVPVHPKVATGAASGALVTLIVFAAAAFGVAVPAGVAAALVVVLTFVASYLR